MYTFNAVAGNFSVLTRALLLDTFTFHFHVSLVAFHTCLRRMLFACPTGGRLSIRALALVRLALPSDGMEAFEAARALGGVVFGAGRALSTVAILALAHVLVTAGCLGKRIALVAARTFHSAI